MDHYNRLVELEAEYASAGREVVRGTEDWVGLNRTACVEIAGAVETHDRGTVAKRMPAALVSLDFLRGK